MSLISDRVLLFCIVASIFFFADGSVHEYFEPELLPKGNAFVLHGGSEGLYASVSDSNASAIANGESFIRFQKITFKRTKEAVELQSKMNGETGLVQAVVFEVEDRETIGGSAYGGQRAICCTSDLEKLGSCTQGKVIHRTSTRNPGWPKVYDIPFEGQNLYTSMESKVIQITSTGMYNLYFIHCNPNLKGLTVEGKTIWKNPTGYLPGRMAPLMNFYGCMSLAFVLLGLLWFYQYARFWKEVMPLQNCITLVIGLGMFEMALWYFEYAAFNETGVRPYGITMWAVTFGTVKRTVARVVILMVSMGYGVVRPTLGGLTSKVLLLGGTFFMASEILEFVENVGSISDFAGKTRLFLVLPVALLDAFFILWIFTSLSKTLEKLQSRRMTAKLDIYRKFTNALAAAVLVSVGSICYELYFKSIDTYNQRWQTAWIIPAFWQVLSFLLLCIICWLWAPSQNSMRYAYSEDAGEDFDREDTMTLIRPARSLVKDEHNAGFTEIKHVHASDDSLPCGEDFQEDKRE